MNVRQFVAQEFGIDTLRKVLFDPMGYYELIGRSVTPDHVFMHQYAFKDYTGNQYKVIIQNDGTELHNYMCNCEEYHRHRKCVHVAYVLYDDISEIISYKYVDEYKETRKLLKQFMSTQESKGTMKQKLNYDIRFDFSYRHITFKLYVGGEKTYVLNTKEKYENFFDAVENGTEFRLGKNFVYHPNHYYISEEDKQLFHFFLSLKKDNENTYISNSSYFDITYREWNYLLKLIGEHSFSIVNKRLKGYKEGLPTKLELTKENNSYYLSPININEYQIVNNNPEYIIYQQMLYHLENEEQKIMTFLYERRIPRLAFKKSSLKTFTQGLLPKVKQNILLDENIKEIVVSTKPIGSYYFDYIKDYITCTVKIKYDNEEVSYFEETPRIVRDKDYEEKLVQNLLSTGFMLNQDKFVLDDLEKIVSFITNDLPKLSEKYQVYTNKKLDQVKIVNKVHTTSHFSIGREGILSYQFDIDDVDKSEIAKILDQVHLKKKYYRLKNGNVLNLENEDLTNLDQMVQTLDIDAKKLTEEVEIPKYRALYIDSLKKQQGLSITTNHSFDEFIKNFEKYKNVDITFSKEDEKTLRDYQKEGVKWLYTQYKCDFGGILADEMGLGKSLQAICFIKQILKEKPDAKILIVSPTSLIYNWKKEFDKFASTLKYIVVAENKLTRKQILSNMNKYNIFITTYGLVRNDKDAYEDVDFECCIIDEAQSIKNYQANMTREIKKIKAHTKFALTGTPLENSLFELWSIFDFVLPGYLGTVQKFKEKYGIKDVDEESLNHLTILKKLIQPFILRRKKEEVIKDLPEKIENNIYLEFSDLQKSIYVQELRKSKEEMDELIEKEGFQKARFKILQLLTKLRQICIAPEVLYENYYGEQVKIEKTVELIQNAIKEGHKILIFSSFKRVLEVLKERLTKENITFYMIYGSVKSKERMRLVESFNHDDTNCFLITLKAGGTGLNLTSADIVIHLDIWWNPQVENQATDRTHRIGQKNKVSVIKLIVNGTVEEKILELQEKKKILSEHILEGSNHGETLSALTEEELQNLFTYSQE